jgi:heat shock protein HslJ
VRRAVLVWLLLGLLAGGLFVPGALVVPSAFGEEATRRFPLDQRFVVTYLNGQDFGSKSLTLSVRREGRGFRAIGYSGCNTFGARVGIEMDRFVMGHVGTTRKFCHGDRMKTEGEFLMILRAVKHWKMDGRQLVLMADNATLVLSPASRTARAD